MNFNDLIKEAHENAKAKGWHETERSPLEFHALIHSEIAEATEEVRKGHSEPIYQIQQSDLIWQEKTVDGDLLNQGEIKARMEPEDSSWDSKIKPQGEAIELADVVIRIADYFGFREWDSDLEKFSLEGKKAWEKLFNKPLEFFSYLHYNLAFASENGSRVDPGPDFEREKLCLGRVVFAISKYFDFKGWNLEEAIRLKMDFNKTRPYRHGGKKY